MEHSDKHPTTEIAAAAVASMTGEEPISSNRLPTGEQNFVFDVKTTASEYVIRMTDTNYKNKFEAAIYWQEKLIPLGVPLARFIKTDLDQQYSPFPSLLMKRLPGDDLINVYPHLTDDEKKKIAIEIARIQSLLESLPVASFYGYSDRYDHTTHEKSWYDFLVNRLILFKDIIAKNAAFNPYCANQAITIAKNIEDDLKAVKATPFLWDASERNVLIYQGKITGIVDVDEMCFGDPLFVIALTATALECEGYDTAYTDYWAQALQLDLNGSKRLNFYKLFYTVTFMRKHSMQTSNKKTATFDIDLLNKMFDRNLKKLL